MEKIIVLLEAMLILLPCCLSFTDNYLLISFYYMLPKRCMNRAEIPPESLINRACKIIPSEFQG
uniref:Uncharacterized protein n=1 Tax=Onchocerca volvulus TaxID=6282 RepID=A0A8R1TZV4_ONCVO